MVRDEPDSFWIKHWPLVRGCVWIAVVVKSILLWMLFGLFVTWLFNSIFEIVWVMTHEGHS